MSLFWAVSVASGLAVNAAVLHPKVRRATNIPMTDVESETPYARIWANRKAKWARMRTKWDKMVGRNSAAK